MSPVPFGRRDRLISEVGPNASGSYPGFAWTHSPEKSGTDAALASPLAVGPAVGTTACRKAGVAAAAESVATRRKSRHCKSIALVLFQAFRWKLSRKATLFTRAFGRGRWPLLAPPGIALHDCGSYQGGAAVPRSPRSDAIDPERCVAIFVYIRSPRRLARAALAALRCPASVRPAD